MATTAKKPTLGSPQPVKKLVIKNLKEKPKLPENFEDDTWDNLRAAVNAIHSKSPVAQSLEELYRAAENLCLHKMSQNLYNRLQSEVERHIKAELATLVAQTSDYTVYLTLVNTVWQEHCKDMVMIRSIFLYLDRTYVIQNSQVRSLWDMGLYMFRQHIASNAEVETKTIAALLNVIERERQGETVNRSLLKSLLRMCSALQIYTEKFERPFLDATSDFYAREGQLYMQEIEVADYLKHCEKRIHDEGERVMHYLDAATRKPLIQLVERQLLDQHVSALLIKGFDTLMHENRLQDLARMYNLFSRVNALDKLKAAFFAYIKTTGQTIVADPEKDKTQVQDLLDFKARIDHILEQAFASNESFTYALKDAFSAFINSRANKPAELIAKFIDSKLKSGSKGLSEEELEVLLDRLMVIFRYINGKDVFEAFYKKDLAKRLLLQKSASSDAEKAMISKLKQECGGGFTNKLEGMFKDIDLSRDIMAAFHDYVENKHTNLKDVELNVFVLTTGFWPPYPPVEVKLPRQMSEYQEVFKAFYLQKHNGRRLMWQNSLGHCVLRANFPLGKKELQVSLFQTVVLMLFNESDKLTFKDIQDSTGIDTKELRVTLQSLALGKAKILAKNPKTKDVAETDEFQFNREFKEKLYRIKVNAIQLKETVEEQQKTTETVFHDRQYQVDAAIVRIMKMRKTLAHNMLITELYSQLKFPAKPTDLKKRIESLIEREYLERDSNTTNVYHYLA